MCEIAEKKAALRGFYAKKRAEMPLDNKKAAEELIFENLVGTREYSAARVIMTYVSVNGELDTRKLIEKALSDKKAVAVPKCVKGTRLMDFYVIKSLDDMDKGAFSLLEPNEQKCKKLCLSDGVLMIVPGFCFDENGFRVGYGGGYYDRFLCGKKIPTAGLCFESCFIESIPKDNFDIPTDIVITERGVYHINERA